LIVCLFVCLFLADLNYLEEFWILYIFLLLLLFKTQHMF